MRPPHLPHPLPHPSLPHLTPIPEHIPTPKHIPNPKPNQKPTLNPGHLLYFCHKHNTPDKLPPKSSTLGDEHNRIFQNTIFAILDLKMCKLLAKKKEKKRSNLRNHLKKSGSKMRNSLRMNYFPGAAPWQRKQNRKKT